MDEQKNEREGSKEEADDDSDPVVVSQKRDKHLISRIPLALEGDLKAKQELIDASDEITYILIRTLTNEILRNHRPHPTADYLERAVALLLECKADPNDGQDDQHLNRTPMHFLHNVNARNYPKICKLLVDAKGDVNGTDNDNWTPIVYTTQYCKEKNLPTAIRTLLECGANSHPEYLEILMRTDNSNSKFVQEAANLMSDALTIPECAPPAPPAPQIIFTVPH